MVSQHTATIEWQRGSAAFTDNRYSRGHRWTFDGGLSVAVSSSPHVVPLPMSDPAAVDPEEAFVAALSSCHMLWFLSIAARKGWSVDTYRDEAVGVMAPDSGGALAITVVTLQPAVVFSGERRPTRSEVENMHHEAHSQCFLANSVRSEVRLEPVWPDAEPGAAAAPAS